MAVPGGWSEHLFEKVLATGIVQAGKKGQGAATMFYLPWPG